MATGADHPRTAGAAGILTMAQVEIPLIAGPQAFRTRLGAAEYRLALLWREVEPGDPAPGGWVLDIFDANGAALVRGIALVPGADLLAPHRALGFTGSLYAVGTPDPDATPAFEGLGTATRLAWVDDAA